MKNQDNIKDLKAQEKFYFDTYKTKRTNDEKATHLEQMANIIRQIDKLQNT